MAFRPDFYVVAFGSPSAIQLVVEARLRPEVAPPSEPELKRYMLAMGCPVGLLVTPTKIWLYKDNYTNRSESSIERKGPYSVPSDSVLTKVAKKGNPSEFEQAVRSWLEHLTGSRSLKGFSEEAVEAFDALVLPALSTGVIQGSGPGLDLTA